MAGACDNCVRAPARSSNLSQLAAKTAEIAGGLAGDAQANVDRLKYARGFFETRPPVPRPVLPSSPVLV